MASTNVNDAGDVLKPGEIGIDDYLTKIEEANSGVKNKDAIISSISAELENIAGTINRTIEMIEMDPEIQYCVNGRDLSQITGKKGDKTIGRFPNLLNQLKMQMQFVYLPEFQKQK